jgi:hypothetical protein
MPRHDFISATTAAAAAHANLDESKTAQVAELHAFFHLRTAESIPNVIEDLFLHMHAYACKPPANPHMTLNSALFYIRRSDILYSWMELSFCVLLLLKF